MENHLLTQFDRLIKERGYANRSEAIRDLIRDELVERQCKNSDTESIGTVTIIFNHHIRELTESLTSIQHDFEKQIISTTHVHLDHDYCLEVVIVKGKTNVIQTIANQLISQKGVKHGKLVMTTTGRNV